MRAGDLDRRITIESYSYTIGEYGELIETWTPLPPVWANVQQEGGREFFAAAAIQSEAKVVFRLRYIEGITVIHRLIYDGREHDIHEVRELGRREGLELHTTTMQV